MEEKEKREFKKQLFYRYTDFAALQGIGAGWIGQIKNYIPTSAVIIESASLQILNSAFHLNIPTWGIIVFLTAKYYFMMVLNWIVGKIAIKSGILAAQQQYGAKKEHLSPYNREVIDTMEAICLAVGAQSKFTKL